MTEPISPAQARAEHQSTIPAFVIAAFNKLLVSKISSTGRVYLPLDEAFKACVAEAREQGTVTSSDELARRNWLDVEPLFREKGWTVTFVKTGYNSSDPDYFQFQAPAK